VQLLGRARAHRREDRAECVVVERVDVAHRLQVAVDPADRRLADLEVDVGGAELDGAQEEVVEVHRPLRRGIGGRGHFL